MGQHAQRLALGVLALEAGEELLAWLTVTDEEGGGFGEGPLQVGLPIFAPETTSPLSWATAMPGPTRARTQVTTTEAQSRLDTTTS